MKFFLTIFYFFVFCCANAQVDSLLIKQKTNPKRNIQKFIIADSTKVKNFKNAKKEAKLTNTTDTIKTGNYADTTKQKDTSDVVKDTAVNTTLKKDSNTYSILADYPIINNNTPELMITSFKVSTSKDILFYALLFIVIFLGVIKLIFPRYLKNIFAIIFQTQFRQVQTREQLSQDNVASILLNILFFLSTSFFISLSLENIGFTKYNFWQTTLFACISLIGIYLFKLIFTQFLGFIYNESAAAKAYNFIVFIINKILGIILIPVSFLVAFSGHILSQRVIHISIIIIFILLIFRLVITYRSVSNILKINAFHFFLYFCCVEILPLLIMFKFLNHYISNGI